jgi:H+-transporting ATPase
VVAIVFASQATIYAMRDRQSAWGLRPSGWLVFSSVADMLIISTLATLGIAMSPLPIWVVGEEFAVAVVFGIFLDLIKIPIFGKLRIS